MKQVGRALLVGLLSVMVFICPGTAGALGQYQAAGLPEPTEEIAGLFDSALLLDLDADAVLYAKEADRAFSPVGSAVHLMNAYIMAMEADFAREIPVIDAVNNLPGTVRKIGLRPDGQRWLVEDLIAAMMLQGAQDAAMVLSDHVSDSEEAYIESMNAYAAELGMANTRFVSPLGGYEREQQTTVTDLAALAVAALAHEDLRAILTAAHHDAINGVEIEARLDAMREGRSGYDARIQGVGEGSTASSGANILLHLDDGARRLLLIGFTEDDDQSGLEEDAIAILEFFLTNTTRVDVTETVRTLLSGLTITALDGAAIVPAMQEGAYWVTAERTAAESFLAELRLGELPVLAGAPEAGASIGEIPLLYGEDTLLAVPLEAGSVTRIDPVSEEATTVDEMTFTTEIPTYSAEDWQGANRELDFLDRFGFFIIVGGVALLAAVVLLAAHFLQRRKKR